MNGAEFSPDGVYRYRLWREWDASLPRCAFVMLNPSTADASQNDPTIRRCIGYATRWGYGALDVVNLFGYRATNPRELRTALDPVGPGNDEAILWAARVCRTVFAAWGVHGAFRGRDRYVEQLLAEQSIGIYALGLTKDGHPRHPLYLPSDIREVVMLCA